MEKNYNMGDNNLINKKFLESNFQSQLREYEKYTQKVKLYSDIFEFVKNKKIRKQLEEDLLLVITTHHKSEFLKFCFRSTLLLENLANYYFSECYPSEQELTNYDEIPHRDNNGYITTQIRNYSKQNIQEGKIKWNEKEYRKIDLKVKLRFIINILSKEDNLSDIIDLEKFDLKNDNPNSTYTLWLEIQKLIIGRNYFVHRDNPLSEQLDEYSNVGNARALPNTLHIEVLKCSLQLQHPGYNKFFRAIIAFIKLTEYQINNRLSTEENEIETDSLDDELSV